MVTKADFCCFSSQMWSSAFYYAVTNNQSVTSKYLSHKTCFSMLPSTSCFFRFPFREKNGFRRRAWVSCLKNLSWNCLEAVQYQDGRKKQHILPTHEVICQKASFGFVSWKRVARNRNFLLQKKLTSDLPRLSCLHIKCISVCEWIITLPVNEKPMFISSRLFLYRYVRTTFSHICSIFQ